MLETIIMQTCDRCKDKRDIPNKAFHTSEGWKEIKTNRHLCPNCIHVILEEKQ